MESESMHYSNEQIERMQQIICELLGENERLRNLLGTRGPMIEEDKRQMPRSAME